MKPRMYFSRTVVFAACMAGLGLWAGFALVESIHALPTDITVRVIAKGAKFVGSSMGGARVSIRDADTGELLAQGVTLGSTGDTDRIMREARTPAATLSSEGSAYFSTQLDLDEPRWIEITAYGPIAQRQSANRASVTLWVVPGKHLGAGDGVLLELPGFVVDVLSPPAHARVQGVPQELELRANIVMMCGCPLYPEGLWDPTKFQIEAILKRDGETIGSLSLDYADDWSQFAATWTIDAPGTYEAVVYAHDPANGNTGLDRVTVLVRD